MTLPGDVRTGVEAALSAARGAPARITHAAPLGGGCISPSARVETADGLRAFVKWGDEWRMFEEEARSLAALEATSAFRVPAVLGLGRGADGAGTPWLLLEWLEPGAAGPDTWADLGRALAAVHAKTSDRYGWASDNFIGSLPQANGWSDDWATFWRERRLEPQLRLAYAAGHFDGRARQRFDALLERLDEVLAGAAAEPASLLHGDLWSGNVHVVEGGDAALIDPSSYYGHREVDLAMSELFGGFGRDFHAAYHEAWPVAPGYRPARRAAYQLYYLLVHVNLFGGGYVGGTLRALGESGFSVDG